VRYHDEHRCYGARDPRVFGITTSGTIRHNS